MNGSIRLTTLSEFWKANYMNRHGPTIRVNGKQKYIARLIIEQELGRELKTEEVIHHIDGNVHNNDRSNLLLTNHSGHNKIHKRKGNFEYGFCFICKQYKPRSEMILHAKRWHGISSRCKECRKKTHKKRLNK